MRSSSVKFTKGDKLEKPNHSVPWSLLVKSFIIREDSTLLSFQPKLARGVEKRTKWVSANSKIQSTILFLISDFALSKRRYFVDGKLKAKALLEEQIQDVFSPKSEKPTGQIGIIVGLGSSRSEEAFFFFLYISRQASRSTPKAVRRKKRYKNNI